MYRLSSYHIKLTFKILVKIPNLARRLILLNTYLFSEEFWSLEFIIQRNRYAILDELRVWSIILDRTAFKITKKKKKCVVNGIVLPGLLLDPL